MKNHSDVELIAMRGMLCQMECEDFLLIGQYGTDEYVVEITGRVLLSGHAIFEEKAPMDREIKC